MIYERKCRKCGKPVTREQIETGQAQQHGLSSAWRHEWCRLSEEELERARDIQRQARAERENEKPQTDEEWARSLFAGNR
jgi:hypothetical protein